jgi:hypothetical protein
MPHPIHYDRAITQRCYWSILIKIDAHVLLRWCCHHCHIIEDSYLQSGIGEVNCEDLGSRSLGNPDLCLLLHIHCISSQVDRYVSVVPFTDIQQYWGLHGFEQKSSLHDASLESEDLIDGTPHVRTHDLHKLAPVIHFPHCHIHSDVSH